MSVPSSVTIADTIDTLNGVIVIGTLLGAASTDAGGDTIAASNFGLTSFSHLQLLFQ